MPLPLRIIAIILAALFFIYTIRLIRKNIAEVRHMLKWFILALVILFGALFSELASKIANAVGVKTLTSFALFVLVGMLIMISLRYQISLISAEKQIKTLIQEISILRKDMKDAELDQSEKQEKVNQATKNLEQNN
ncbi:DUF2304 family protein [Lactococcus raffinolactis]|nr:DUF2304 domain-containing protein [Lactococcus raffinolactis]MDT2766943.1 DUF2304 domain-containing protein [Lactococcus raffinolactis]MDT2790119.1 DUF2304 domain-containing protein [Lactococcus raffinolactis]QIW61710.1 DUF2304 family protein [Lactococcus raffinolactis]